MEKVKVEYFFNHISQNKVQSALLKGMFNRVGTQ